MRLREDLPDEEVDEAPVVTKPVVLVELRPAFVGVELVLPRIPRARRVRRSDERDGRPDDERPLYTLGVPSREVERVEPAERDACDARDVDARRIEHGDGVPDELDRAVCLCLQRPIGEPVSAGIERQHAEMASKVGKLRLPEARVHDPPARQ
jgi:hypothetical protein